MNDIYRPYCVPCRFHRLLYKIKAILLVFTIAVCTGLLPFTYFPSVALAEENRPQSEDQAYGLDLSTTLFVGPASYYKHATTIGTGFVLKFHYRLTKIFALGLSFENLWLFPDYKPKEYDVSQKHIFFTNRIILMDVPIAVSLELGMGVVLYFSTVNDKFIDYQYEVVSCDPSTYVGVYLMVPVHKYLYIQGGARFMYSFTTYTRVSEVQDGLPSPVVLLFDIGMAMRF